MDIWNSELEISREREIKSKDYISAGEIGMPFLDRWLKMKGTPPTNPFDTRVLRIFACGSEFHHIIRKVFEKTGILINAEQYVEIPATGKTLKVLGYYDIKIGGFSDWEIAKENIKNSDLSDITKEISYKLIEQFKIEYPLGLAETICEIKSINSNAFWHRKDYIAQGYKHHQLQLWTYLKAANINQGKLFYISKDDLTLEECPIFLDNKELAKDWQEDVETMTKYYKENIKPERENDVVFDKDKEKYQQNWRIGRSVYLTHITGKTKEQWEKETMSEVRKLNKELKEKKKNA